VNQSAFNAEYSSFVKLLGTEPKFLNYFLNENEPLSGWSGNAQWAATSAAASAAKSATPIIALPLTSSVSGLTADQQYKAFASGQYDSVVQGVVKAWAQQGFSNQVWRPGWEMNIPSMPSYAGTDPQTQADWVAAFQHVSTVLHQAAAANGVTVQVVWNPSVTNYDTLGVLKNLYPGNAYVDVIGADVYADAYPYSDGTNAAGQQLYHNWSTGGEDTSLTQWLADPVNRTHYWTNPAATKWSLDGSSGHNLSLQTLLDFAKAQGKPFAVPETGAGNAAGGHDVADDAAFPAWLSQTLQASNVAIKFVSIWDSNGGGNFEFSSASAGKPLEAAAWAKYFGATPVASAADTITLKVSEDAFNGDAHFTITVDGQQIGGVQVATASHAAGATQAISLQGNLGAGPHTVGVTFLDDAYGGPNLDRNLYVDSVAFNGTTVAGGNAALYWNRTASVALPAKAATETTPSDTLTINVSEDAYAGDAQFLLTVDGNAVGGPLTATASHAAGQTATMTFVGSFGTGPHTAAVTFLNDAYGGTGQDRNLYIDAMTFNGKAVAGAASAFYWNQTQSIAIPASAALVTGGTTTNAVSIIVPTS